MKNIFENKRLEEISEDDLDNLVEIGFKENRFIEYKRDMYGGSDSQKTEMLADISAFANAHGGYLLIGIEEDGEGKAQTVIGIDNFNCSADWIRNLCQSSIDEYIQGLSVNPIELANGKGVIVVSVPNSPNKPHMITFGKRNRFYIRRDEGKDLMNIEEIRDSIIKTEQFMSNLEEFYTRRIVDVHHELKKNLEKILDTSLEVYWMVLSASPIFLNQDRLDVAINDDIEKCIIEFEKMGVNEMETTIEVGTPNVDINGILAENYDNYIEKGRGEYLQIWNNGYIEYGLSMLEFSKSYLEKREEGAEHVKSFRIENPFIPNRIYSACYLIHNIWEIFQINEPTAIGLTFINCEDITLEPPTTKKYWRHDQLKIKPIKFVGNVPACEYAYDILTKLFRCFNFKEPVNRDGEMLFNDSGEYGGFKKLSI